MKTNSRIGELLFSISFYLFLISRLIKVSTLQVLLPVDSKVTWIIRGVMVIFVILKWGWLTQYRNRHIIPIFIVLLFSVIQGVMNRNTVLFDIVLLLLLSYKVPLNRILKQYTIVIGSSMVVLFVLSLVGVIENFAFDAGERGLRYSFGHVYATDFAAMLLVLQMTSSIVFRFGRTFAFMLLSCALGYVVYYFTDARTSFLLCVLFAFLRYIIPKLPVYWHKFSWVAYTMPVLVIVSFLVNAFYTSKIEGLRILNNLLSGRLIAGHRALHEIGVSLLGNNISMKGNGWSPNPFTIPDIDYFIDSSYLNIGIIYGVVALLTITFGFTLFTKQAIEKEKLALTLSLIFISVIAMIEHHLLEVIYNPFIFGLSSLWLSKWEMNKSLATIEVND